VNPIRLTLREIGLRLREPFRISSGVARDRRILLVELEGASGAVGWGECVAGEDPYFSPETVDTAWFAIERWVAPRVLGRPFAHPREISPRLEEGFRGHPMAKAAVEMSCWALAAEERGLPLARLLGGEREEVPVGISLGLQEEPAALVARALEAAARGYRKIKLKIAPGADLDYVAAVRAELGPAAPLAADANSAYRPEDTDHLAALDGFGLLMLEQPLDREDLLRHATLQRRLATPICLDESITGPDRAEDMIALAAGRIVNVKPGRVGGFTASLAVHDLCRDAGLPVWCGGMLESGVGRAHNVALASLPGFELPGDLSPSSRYWARDIVQPEWTMDDRGLVRVPWDRPGLGVEVDRERVEALTVRRTRIEAGGGRALS
jgi:O-succinylbenzoate synthase